jgi:L-alanine-DL-glutamate epimerase-like enolase superfamily enzyme
MRIARIETHLAPKGNVAVVRVYTDDGAEGIGQTAPYRADLTVGVLHEMVAPLFLGHDPWEVGALTKRCLTKLYKFTGTFLFRALCGVETALWDLLGKVTGQPVYRLLGGAVRTTIPMYASSLSRTISPEGEAQRMVDLVGRHGFRCVKIKIGGRMGQDTDAAPGRTERIVPLLREALGDGVDISADANGAFTTHRAIQIGRLLERHRYFHYEEPCPYTEWENTAAVAAALDIPVAGGEQDNSLATFARLIRLRAVDIVQLDIGYLGGIGRARRVAELAELAGLPCTPHCSNHSLLQVFVLHLAAAMPACHQYQEWRADADQPWADAIYEPLLEVVDGAIAVPDRPGWGIAIQPGFLREAETRVSQ